MIPEKIKYTAQFEYMGLSEWLSLYGSILPTETFLDAYLDAKRQVIEAYKNGNPQVTLDSVILKSEKVEPPLEEDPEFEALKIKLLDFKTKEEATAYLETTPFKFTIEAKKIVATIK